MVALALATPMSKSNPETTLQRRLPIPADLPYSPALKDEPRDPVTSVEVPGQ